MSVFWIIYIVVYNCIRQTMKKCRCLVVFMCIPEMKPWRQHGHYTSINQLHEIVPDMSSQSSIMVNLVCLAISYTEKVAVGASLFVEKCKVHLGDHTQKLHFVVKGNSISFSLCFQYFRFWVLQGFIPFFVCIVIQNLSCTIFADQYPIWASY